jgi:RNA methyltransferase, TrmH family
LQTKSEGNPRLGQPGFTMPAANARLAPMPPRFPLKPGATATSPRSAESRHEIISSRENKWLKQFRATLRGTGPATGEPIGVEGAKLIADALESGLVADALLVSESAEALLERVLRRASKTEAGVPRSRIFRTTDKLFQGVAATETPQGIAALFRQRGWSFEDILRGRATADGAYRGESPLVVAIVGVQDPGNVGTIVRSAEAFGATGVAAARGTADPWSPKAVRASAGSALRLPLVRGVSVPVLLTQLRMADVKLVAATVKTGSSGSDATPVDWRERIALFIGSEGSGLPAEIVKAADAQVTIPLREEVESLNAGVAASLLLYEAAKQRNAN